MKHIIFFTLILISGICFSCEREKEDPQDSLTSDIMINKSNNEFTNLMSNRSEENSDPFELISIVFENGVIKITVAYSGGCKVHTFNITWDEVVTSSNPPGINLIITHNANGDACEAYITETLIFPFTEIIDSLWANEPINVGAFSGWDPDDSVEHEGNGYDFNFEESDECKVTVTAREVICGNGLYDNLWFALDDSTSIGISDYYFYNYLQPVAIDESIKDFKPVPGKKYSIGARITTDNPFWDQPVCLAFSGPSISVKIMCINEVK